MKKVISISLSIIMTVAVIHFSVAKHYCGGKEVASILSLSGKTASCGMADPQENLPATGTYIYEDCCKNVVAFFGIGTNYFPSFYSINPVNTNLSQLFSTPVDFSNYKFIIPGILHSDNSPPGAYFSNIVDLPFICTFRI